MDGGYRRFYYPSGACRAGDNPAIRPGAVAKKMRLAPGETRIVRVTEALGYGVFETEDEYTLKTITAGDMLDWEKAKQPAITV